MTIINESIPTSTFPDGNVCHQFLKFPDAWKETRVTPVLKKGDKTVKENYRPVSCLLAASKLLELVVCDKTTVVYFDQLSGAAHIGKLVET